jgi:hypothetical protein
MPAQPVCVQPTGYLISLWPEGHECDDMVTWCLKVTYRGNREWAIEQGWTGGSRKPVMAADGSWHADNHSHPVPLRFTLDEALDVARRHAADVKFGGVTAAEAFSRHEQEGCPDAQAATASTQASA